MLEGEDDISVDPSAFIYPSFAWGVPSGIPCEGMDMFERSPEANLFYGSNRWKKCRKKYLSLHPICERCQQLGIISKADHVHHKVYLDDATYRNPEVSLNFDNLEALCMNCHQAEHHRSKDCRDDLYFDAAGNLKKG